MSLGPNVRHVRQIAIRSLRYQKAAEMSDQQFCCGAGVRKKIAFGQGSSQMSQTSCSSTVSALHDVALQILRFQASCPCFSGDWTEEQGRVEMPWMMISMPCFRTLECSERQGSGWASWGSMKEHG
jgi:hypothetical protein